MSFFRVSNHALQPGWVGALLLATTILTGTGAAHAAPLTAADILGQFNAVVTGTVSTSADIEGRLAAGTIARAATLYNNPRIITPSDFAAVNAITVGPGVYSPVANGGSVNVQGTNAGFFAFSGGGGLTNTPVFTMSDFATPLDTLAAQLARLGANSTVNAADPNNFTFNETPDASGTAVFAVTTAQLAAARSIAFNGSATSIIVNVAGGSLTDLASMFTSDETKHSLIWDFADATTLSFANWAGAVLAPNATVTNVAPIEGTLYAQNYNGNGELHNFNYTGPLPPADPVPEPDTVIMLATAVAALWMVRRRTRA